MIGIKFEIDNDYNSFLSKILLSINTKNYKWYMPLGEVIDQDENLFFSKSFYEDDYFRKKIRKRYYIIHLICHGFMDANVTEINNYDDYINSSCNIVISIIDSTIVNIYSKDAKLLKRIEKNAKENKFTNIKYIYKDNDHQEWFKKMTIIY